MQTRPRKYNLNAWKGFPVNRKFENKKTNHTK